MTVARHASEVSLDSAKRQAPSAKRHALASLQQLRAFIWGGLEATCALQPAQQRRLYAAAYMTERHTPDKAHINLLEPFDRLGLNAIEWVATPAQAAALAQLADAKALGFDTESKPTFAKNEASTGPHVVQLATLNKAWVFQLGDAECRRVVGQLLESPHTIKAGFGLGDDRKRIVHKLGVDLQGVLDLNHVFSNQGYRKDMGVRGAVAVVFNRRFIKSKKAATSNWANPQLSEAQLVYAANDAYAAMRVYAALGLG